MAAPEQEDSFDENAAIVAPITTETQQQNGGNPLPLEATREDLLHCQLSSWFPAFRHLPADDLYLNRSNMTIKSQIIRDLPEKFMEFLLSDGIRLPENATQLSSCAPNETKKSNNDDDSTDWDEDAEDDNDDANSDTSVTQYSFPQLNQQIADAIAKLGGAVVPKLNWSAPKDATWVNEGSLKCQTPGDVYLLLKSSDFCLHDLQIYKDLTSGNNGDNDDGDNNNDTPTNNIQLELVLRKWCNFYPSMEFRCFVRNHVLIGISQRTHTQHYPHLLNDKSRFQNLILDFFENVVCHQFANNQRSHYVFDLYIDKSDRVWVLDFNVWSIQTDALLYTWEELVDMELPLDEESSEEWPEVRVVENALEVRHDPLASYRAPMDTVQLASSSSQQQQQQQSQSQQDPGAEKPATFESFMAMCQKPSDRGDNDGDDNDDTNDDDTSE